MISNLYLRNQLILSTLFLTDIVVGGVTAHIVPEEVPEDRDEGVVELRHGQTVLALQVVGLSLGPVKPLDGLVGCRPEPLPGVVLTVPLLRGKGRQSVRVIRRDQTYICESSQPELSELSHVSDGEKLSLQPVVQSCQYCLLIMIIEKKFINFLWAPFLIRKSLII